MGLFTGISAGVPVSMGPTPAFVLGQWVDMGVVLGISLALATILAIWLAINRVIGVLGGLCVGAAFGVTFFLTFISTYGLAYSIPIGIGVGVACGLAFCLLGRSLAQRTVKHWDEVEVVEALSWSWRYALLGGVFGAASGFLVGWVIGTALEHAWPMGGWGFGIAFGAATGLIGALASGLTRGKLEKRAYPNQGIHQSVQNALLTGGLTFVAVGIPVGIVCWQAWTAFEGPSSALYVGSVVGISIGLAFGLLVSLFRGGLAVIQHAILRLILWANHRTAWDFVRFLDFAAEHVLLRKVGGGYIFVHRLLMEHFTTL